MNLTEKKKFITIFEENATTIFSLLLKLKEKNQNLSQELKVLKPGWGRKVFNFSYDMLGTATSGLLSMVNNIFDKKATEEAILNMEALQESFTLAPDSNKVYLEFMTSYTDAKKKLEVEDKKIITVAASNRQNEECEKNIKMELNNEILEKKNALIDANANLKQIEREYNDLYKQLVAESNNQAYLKPNYTDIYDKEAREALKATNEALETLYNTVEEYKEFYDKIDKKHKKQT